MLFRTDPQFKGPDVAKRLAQICCGTNCDDKIPYRKENSTWVLDHHNDWFLREKGFDEDKMRKWEIDFRYITPELEEALEGMKAFIELELGPIKRKGS